MKYCLLSFSRTGSTALEQALMTHENIHHDMTRLFTLPDRRKWVKDFLKKDTNKMWSGFKCLLYQYDEYLKEDLLTNENVSKIILLRKNVFEAAISKKIAEQVGNWHTRIDYTEIEPFTINENWFASYLDFVKINVDMWKMSSVNYKVFYYEDIFNSDELYSPILNFLNINDQPNKYFIDKINEPKKFKIIIKNYDKLIDIYEEKQCLI